MFYNYICYTEKNEYVPNFFKSIFSNNWRGQQSVCGGYVFSGYGLIFFFFFTFCCAPLQMTRPSVRICREGELY